MTKQPSADEFAAMVESLPDNGRKAELLRQLADRERAKRTERQARIAARKAEKAATMTKAVTKWTCDAARDAIVRTFEHGYKPVIVLPYTLKVESAGKMPGTFHAGTWRGLGQWQSRAEGATLEELTDWHADTNSAPNVGILCGIKTERGYLIGVDIDCDAPELVGDIAKLCHENMAIRIGKNGRSGLVPLLVDQLGDSEKFQCGGETVQLLRSGKQFVALGIHPTMLRPYRWTDYTLGDDIEMPSVDALPCVKLSDLVEAFAANGFQATAQVSDVKPGRKSELLQRLRDSGYDSDSFDELFGDNGPCSISKLADQNPAAAALYEKHEDGDFDAGDVSHHANRLGLSKDMLRAYPDTFGIEEAAVLFEVWKGAGERVERKTAKGEWDDERLVNAFVAAEAAINDERSGKTVAHSSTGRSAGDAFGPVDDEDEDDKPESDKPKKVKELKAYDEAVKAANVTAKPASSQRSGVLTALDHVKSFQPQDERVEGLWPMHGLCSVFGDSNSGKTFFCFAAGKAIAAGRPFNGGDTIKGGVLYVGSEGRESTDARLTALYAALGEAEAMETGLDVADFAELDAADTVHTSFEFPLNKQAREACARFYRIACDYKALRGTFPAVLIIDHIVALLPSGADLSNAVEMQNVNNALHELRHVLGCLIVVIAHTNKSGDFLGSVMQRAGWDRAIRIEKEGEGESAKHTIHSNKWRDGLPGGSSKSFWLVTRELGRTPRGKSATSAVVSFEKPRGRFPRVDDRDELEAEARLSDATRFVEHDTLEDYLADYMVRQKAGAGDKVTGAKFISRDLREAIAPALDHYSRTDRTRVRDAVKRSEQRRKQFERAVSALESQKRVRVEAIQGKHTLIHLLS